MLAQHIIGMQENIFYEQRSIVAKYRFLEIPISEAHHHAP